MQAYEFWLTACVISYAFGETLSVNEQTFEKKLEEHASDIVDELLRTYKGNIIHSGNYNGELRLADIKNEIPLPFPFRAVKIRATNGRLRNVLSLSRIAPAYVDSNEVWSGMVIRSTLRMDTLIIAFDYFHVDLPLLNQNASIQVHVHDCIFNLEIAVLTHTCKAYLRHIKFLSFGGIELHVTGMSWKTLNKFVESIIERYLYNLNTTNKGTLEDYFHNQVDEAVRYVDVCGIVLSRM